LFNHTGPLGAQGQLLPQIGEKRGNERVIETHHYNDLITWATTIFLFDTRVNPCRSQDSTTLYKTLIGLAGVKFGTPAQRGRVLSARTNSGIEPTSLVLICLGRIKQAVISS